MNPLSKSERPQLMEAADSEKKGHFQAQCWDPQLTALLLGN